MRIIFALTILVASTILCSGDNGHFRITAEQYLSALYLLKTSDGFSSITNECYTEETDGKYVCFAHADEIRIIYSSQTPVSKLSVMTFASQPAVIETSALLAAMSSLSLDDGHVRSDEDTRKKGVLYQQHAIAEHLRSAYVMGGTRVDETKYVMRLYRRADDGKTVMVTVVPK